jgi:iron uptake system component EfeO
VRTVHTIRRPLAPALVGLTLGVALAACSSNDEGKRGQGGASGGRTVEVALTDAGCEPAKLDLAAGATTFKVTNKGTDKVSEFEVKQGERILGEVENVTAGLERSFSLNLRPGTYVLVCPGGSGAAEGTLTVAAGAGAGSQASASAEVAAAATRYRRYVEQQTALLVARTKDFVDAVAAGDVAAAKQRYVPARIPYERIEPVAESFGDLDPAIDAREGDVPAAEWGGFHKIERALWVQDSAKGMAPVARKLLADVTQLQQLAGTVALDAPQIANGANELLGEVSKSKITGEEERYSRTDLVDFKANLDGSRAAFEAVRPALVKLDSDLVGRIEQRFDGAGRALAPYARGNAGNYVPYDRLGDSDKRRLSQSIDALAEPLSQVSAKLAAG